MNRTRPASLHSVADTPEQLTFLGTLAATEVPLQFRLDDRTRRRGLAHIARIREQLDAIAAARADHLEPAAASERHPEAA